MELKIDEFYYWKKDSIIRQIRFIEDHSIRYFKYDPVSGDFLGDGVCGEWEFNNSVRDVVPESDTGKMKVHEAAEKFAEEQIRLQVDREIKITKMIKTQILIAELESRGYTVSKK